MRKLLPFLMLLTLPAWAVTTLNLTNNIVLVRTPTNNAEPATKLYVDNIGGSGDALIGATNWIAVTGVQAAVDATFGTNWIGTTGKQAQVDSRFSTNWIATTGKQAAADSGFATNWIGSTGATVVVGHLFLTNWVATTGVQVSADATYSTNWIVTNTISADTSNGVMGVVDGQIATQVWSHTQYPLAVTNGQSTVTFGTITLTEGTISATNFVGNISYSNVTGAGTAITNNTGDFATPAQLTAATNGTSIRDQGYTDGASNNVLSLAAADASSKAQNASNGVLGVVTSIYETASAATTLGQNTSNGVLGVVTSIYETASSATALANNASNGAVQVSAASLNASSNALNTSITGHVAMTGTAVHGLGTASTHADTDFATSAQGTKADNAAVASVVLTQVWSQTQYPLAVTNGQVLANTAIAGTALTNGGPTYNWASNAYVWSTNDPFQDTNTVYQIITNAAVVTQRTSYVDVAAPASFTNPPASGYSRLAGQTVNGQSWLNMIQPDGSSYRVLRDSVFTAYDYTGETLSNGTVVAFTTNMTTTAHWLQKAQANSSLTMPAQGVVCGGDITNGASGNVMFFGRTPTNYLSADLAALPYGTPLYVSAANAGQLVSSVPVSPNNQQSIGYVNYNGAIDVRLGEDIQQVASSVFRTYQLWSSSNSIVMANAYAMRTLDYGSTGVGISTTAISSNGQLVSYCTLAAGLTLLKSGFYQCNPTMYRSTSGGDAISIGAEVYRRQTNGTMILLAATPAAAAQAIGSTALEYVFSLNVMNDTTMSTNDSVVLQFRTSKRGGSPTLYISTGYLNVPVPSTQFALQSDLTTLSNNLIAVDATQDASMSNALNSAANTRTVDVNYNSFSATNAMIFQCQQGITQTVAQATNYFTGFVGIGTNATTTALDVNGSATIRGGIIQTTTDSNNLTGSITIGTNSAAAMITLDSATSGSGATGKEMIRITRGGQAKGLRLKNYDDTPAGFVLEGEATSDTYTNWFTFLSFNANQRIGILTNKPTTPLDVWGNTTLRGSVVVVGGSATISNDVFITSNLTVSGIVSGAVYNAVCTPPVLNGYGSNDISTLTNCYYCLPTNTVTFALPSVATMASVNIRIDVDSNAQTLVWTSAKYPVIINTNTGMAVWYSDRVTPTWCDKSAGATNWVVSTSAR